MTDQSSPPPETSPEECIRAGMYWFGRSDFSAAEAWWNRALELDPQNPRALECLKLLKRTSSIGFKTEAWLEKSESKVQSAQSLWDEKVNTPTPTPDGMMSPPPAAPVPAPAAQAPPAPAASFPPPAPDPFPEAAPPTPASDPFPPSAQIPYPKPPAPVQPAGPVRQTPFRSTTPLPSIDRLPVVPPFATSTPLPFGTPDGDITFESPSEYDPGSGDVVLEDTPAAPTPRVPPASSSTDPLDFATDGAQRGASRSGGWSDPSPAPSPWNEGPSRTAVVTLRNDSGPDAFPERTPLPDLDDDGLRDAIFDVGAAEPDPIVPEPSPAVAPPPPPLESLDISVDVEEPDQEETATPEELIRQARDCLQLHDFNGVLDALDKLPPEVKLSEVARNLGNEANANLLRMYESKIGDFENTPRVLISKEEVIWLNLNHRAGFILSQIDGAVCYEDLIALSGMPRLDTVRILARLIEEKVIG